MLASIWYPSTLLIHEIQLNEGYSAVFTNLKCNLVNFEIPNRFLYSMELSIWNLKIDKITFQMHPNGQMNPQKLTDRSFFGFKKISARLSGTWGGDAI